MLLTSPLSEKELLQDRWHLGSLLCYRVTKFSWACSGITKGFQDLSGISPPRNSSRTLPPHLGPWHSIASPVNRTQLHCSFTDNNTPVIFNSHLARCIFQLEDNEVILSIQASRVSVSYVVRSASWDRKWAPKVLNGSHIFVSFTRTLILFGTKF